MVPQRFVGNGSEKQELDVLGSGGAILCTSSTRSPVLRRSASFSGYAPYKLLDDA